MNTLQISEVNNISTLLSRDYKTKYVNENNINYDFSNNDRLIISCSNSTISKKTIDNSNKTIDFEFYRIADMMYNIELLSKNENNIENIILRCSPTKFVFNNIAELKNCFTIDNPFFIGRLQFICIKLIVKFKDNVEKDIQFKCNLSAFSNEIRTELYFGDDLDSVYCNKKYKYTHGEIWEV